jgi:pyruvate/2-oxoglutarate dehydrogenase complex dihydrolipoamide dehydrogenase (E3) component
VYTAPEIFINVGERPAFPALDGLDKALQRVLERIVDSTSIQELGEVPETLTVLGGGPVGLEFAQLFQRLGSQVHVIQKSKQLLPREDPDLAQNLRDILKEDGLRIKRSTEAQHIEIDRSSSNPITLPVKSSLDNTTTKIAATHILRAVCRRPNTDLLNLSSIGITTNARGYTPTTPFLETTCPGIYALGDCTGDPAFTHISYDDFRIIRDNLNLLTHPSASPQDTIPTLHTTTKRKNLTPSVVFTDP